MPPHNVGDGRAHRGAHLRLECNRACLVEREVGGEADWEGGYVEGPLGMTLDSL